MKRSNWILILGVALCVIGFLKIILGVVLEIDPLGVTEDYVLEEPLEVIIGPDQDAVTIPAGTQIRQTFFKESVAFIEIPARVDRDRLKEVSRGVEE